MIPIVTLTLNPAIDKSAVVERIVAEQKLRCGPPRYDPGGGGINVSRAIQKLGGATNALYPTGGLTGKMLERLLDLEGLHHSPIEVEGLTRENLHIEETSTGKQYRFNMPGTALSADERLACIDAIGTVRPVPEFLVLSGTLPSGAPDDLWARAVRAGRKARARVIVDTSGVPLHLAIAERPYMIKPNLREFEMMFPGSTGSEDDMAAAAQSLVKQGSCNVLVVSLAAAGAIVVSAEGVERLAAPRVTAVSKVGAGDCMVAGIVLSLSRGMSLRDAVRYGLAAGTAAVMRPGTQLCRLEDVEELFARGIA